MTESIAQNCQDFIAQQQSVVLATLSADSLSDETAEPVGLQFENSVAPFLWKNGKIYVYLSELASHCANIKTMIDYNTCAEIPINVSLLLVADQSESPQIFARERLQMQCVPQSIEDSSELASNLLDLFRQQFGEIVDLLATLDFHWFELTPLKGSYVKGFGQAYEFVGLPCQQTMQLRQN